MLRPGGVPRDRIESVLGRALETAPENKIVSPGQLASHYAPGASVRLNATSRRDNEIWLGFGAVSGDLNLSDTGDLREAAANLFAALHRLDDSGRPIAVAPIPDTGLGQAINDRLRRAAAPR
jgi:L-threonylcarbamoyladenylate synthase